MLGQRGPTHSRRTSGIGGSLRLQRHHLHRATLATASVFGGLTQSPVGAWGCGPGCFSGIARSGDFGLRFDGPLEIGHLHRYVEKVRVAGAADDTMPEETTTVTLNPNFGKV